MKDLEAVLASLRSSTNESKAVLGGMSTSEARLVSVQEVVLCRKAVTWLNNSSSVFTMKGRRKRSIRVGFYKPV